MTVAMPEVKEPNVMVKHEDCRIGVYVVVASLRLVFLVLNGLFIEMSETPC